MRFVLVLLAATVAAGGEAAPPAVPFADAAPTVDGALDDACWRGALAIDAFAIATKTTPWPKPMTALLLARPEALYVAFDCAEADTARLKRAHKAGQGVWQDDCLEVFLRAGTGRLDIDHFLVNPAGEAEAVRNRDGREVPRDPSGWKVACRVADGHWTAEFMIPAADLGLDQLRRGDLVGLKLAREDKTVGEDYATWPAGISFRPGEDAPVVIGDANLLLASDGGEAKPWGGRLDGVTPLPGEGMRASASLALQQDVRLRAGRRYLMAVDADAAAPVSLRVRLRQGEGRGDEKIDLAVPAGNGQTLERRFAAGAIGEALFVLRVDDPKGGATTLRRLRIVADQGAEASGPAIPLPCDGTTLVATLVRPVDCRTQRGFCGSAIDGAMDSAQWDGQVWEYNTPGAGPGVGYGWRDNDGLHVQLADADGVDAIVARGGARAEIWRDVPGPDAPDGGTRVGDLPGEAPNGRVLFAQRVRSDRFSFFHVGDGRLAELSFYRLARGAPDLPAPRLLVATADAGQAGDALKLRLERRFGEADRTRRACVSAGAAAPIALPAGRALHLVGAPLAEETAIAAIGIVATLAEPAVGAELSVRVQDPLQPRFEIHGADYVLGAGDRLHLVCDHADQIAQAGAQPWVTLIADRPVRFASLALELYVVPRERAQPEALAWRRLLLQTTYQPLCEARPWSSWYRRSDVETFLATDTPFARYVGDLVETLEHCRRIDADGRDDVVRQYHEWMYRNILRKDPGPMPPFAVKLEPRAGVPAWATLGHQAWMQARTVPAWWIAHRQAPNGEFGGEINDDTDLLGNFASFPWMEDGGVGAQVRASGRLLMGEVERAHLVHGLNLVEMDCLHAYEEGVNLEAEMMELTPGDPRWVELCLVATGSLERLTAVTASGHRHFRTWSIGGLQVDAPPEPVAEGGCHWLMLHPALELARWNRHPRAVKLLTEWADGWLAHQHPGANAETIRLPAEEEADPGREPFPGTWGAQASMFVAIAELTGDRRYVQPLLDELAGGGWFTRTFLLPELYDLGFLDPDAARKAVGSHWRLALQLDGDTAPLARALAGSVEELQRFPHLYTTAEQFDDRVFMDPVHDVATAYCGGYGTRNKLDHAYGIAWEGFGTDLAAVVRDNRVDRLSLRVRNLASAERSGALRIARLAHGRYRLTVGADADDDGVPDAGAATSEVELGRGSRLPLTLPADGQVALLAERIAPLDDIALRADLAIGPGDVVRDGAAVTVVVHSLGHAGAPATAVALVDADGRELARQEIPALAAPLELTPVTATATFPLRAAHAGLTVVVDPDGRLSQISRDNDRAPVP